MSDDNNIILVTDDNNISNTLKPKLVLLREVDDILTTSYSEAVNKIKNILPETVLIYCSVEKNECLAIIKEIRTNEKTKNISIILILDKYNQDFVLNAYDENITDFLTIDSDDAEILIRTIWGMRKNANMATLCKQRSLLEELDVINKMTGFYTEKYCCEIFENEFKDLKENKTDGILMLVSPSEESKTKLNPVQLAKAIKISIRNSDVVVHGSSNRFYVLLVETQLKGAFCVWEKIKRAVGEQYNLNAGISTIEENSFEKLKSELLNALIEANSTNQDLVIVSTEEKKSSSDWLDKINSAQKNFKIFKQAFNKKLDKVITPVFFQMQKLYEEKLLETQIEQYSNSTLSTFILKKSNKISELKITYPGFAKINIDIIHEGLDSPENKRISLDLTELDESRLTQILEDFINEFKIENSI
jgi:DNA-binding response OmpR family regulator